jgi:hypothetical protein
MYNCKMVESGYAIPYFVYPNAVSITEEGGYSFDYIEKMQLAAAQARKKNLVIWEHIDDMLLPMELRFLTRREPPAKYCADLGKSMLHPPEDYFGIPVVDRLFFYPKVVVQAICMGFRPARTCDSWLHKIWRGLHPDSPEEKEIGEIQREKIRN